MLTLSAALFFDALVESTTGICLSTRIHRRLWSFTPNLKFSCNDGSTGTAKRDEIGTRFIIMISVSTG
ncbi:hypothetical protein AX774_g7357 [Zancudomyces culisetae]|uniref:Secreted protein n=1 Tax=Zancudomyces culisetae TaxID=1213189 RepID=A0A1R1PE34_ZANCU|nr:hypothetical protein AX774_g7357 [Zancudomyces culisetae]|eukprot:OMH79237.1 hypothetical protein AX774_g7357 [Zancudomyces culisetae]